MEYARFSSLVTDMLAKLGMEKKDEITHHPAYESIKEGRYLYDPQSPEDYIFRSGDYQADHISSVGLKLVSEVVWISELEYKLVLANINHPDVTELNVGDILHAKIVEITDDYFVTKTIFNGVEKLSKLWFA